VGGQLLRCRCRCCGRFHLLQSRPETAVASLYTSNAKLGNIPPFTNKSPRAFGDGRTCALADGRRRDRNLESEPKSCHATENVCRGNIPIRRHWKVRGGELVTRSTQSCLQLLPPLLPSRVSRLKKIAPPLLALIHRLSRISGQFPLFKIWSPHKESISAKRACASSTKRMAKSRRLRRLGPRFPCARPRQPAALQGWPGERLWRLGHPLK
jgi:hypothetical protein